MKNGIRIAGIITIILYSVLVLVFTIVGLVNMVTYNIAVSEGDGDEVVLLIAVATTFFILAGAFLLGLIFSAVLIAKRNSLMAKGAGIALGVIGVLFAAYIHGILFIVDSAKSRN